MLDGLTLQEVVFRGTTLLVLIALTGFILAAVSGLLGDRGPRHDGRLSLNPIRHLDLGGIVGAVIAQIGWMKAMPVDAGKLRGGRGGLVLCAVVCLLAALLLAVVAGWLAPRARLSFAGSFGLYLALWLETLARLAIWFAVFNLIPLPPLVGGHLLAAAAPAAAVRLRSYAPNISFALVVLLLLKLPQRVLTPLYEPIAAILLP